MSDPFGFDEDFVSIGQAAEAVVASVQERLPLANGIYFNLSEEDYHADPALGSTSIRQLATAPCLWQYKKLRPKERVETEAMTWGKAWHCRILEGKQAFDERYARPPAASDFPKALTTTESIKEFLKQHGQKVTGNKPDLVARAKDIDECPVIFDDILDEWKKSHPNHQEITPVQMQEIEDAVSNMQRDPILRAVMNAGSLIDGAAEMSIFYEADGVRRKARLDYSLAPTETRQKAMIVDLKSFTTYKDGTDEYGAIYKIYSEMYDVQGTDYLDARLAARELFQRGSVYGAKADEALNLKEFLFAEDVDWVWVMIRRDRGMIPVMISADGNDPMFQDRRNTIAYALENYRTYMEGFGPDQLWTPPPRIPLRLNKSTLPTFNRGILNEQPADR